MYKYNNLNLITRTSHENPTTVLNWVSFRPEWRTESRLNISHKIRVKHIVEIPFRVSYKYHLHTHVPPFVCLTKKRLQSRCVIHVRSVWRFPSTIACAKSLRFCATLFMTILSELNARNSVCIFFANTVWDTWSTFTWTTMVQSCVRRR